MDREGYSIGSNRLYVNYVTGGMKMASKTNDFRITEKRNPASMKIDKMDTEEILQLINKEDKGVAEAVEEEIPQINNVIDMVAERMKKGGRLFYVGAGTSGRLGVLDAVECVPTFSVASDRVIGILAGGEKAMFRAQENIEDNQDFGAEAICNYEIGENDSVIGIAASGKTPYVIGAVKEANKRGAFTASLVCTNDSKLAEATQMAMTPIVGPEVVTGSTRMKAGTAQKMILNMISTTVMIKLGKVYSNLMVDLNASNQKLRQRAENIFQIITDAGREEAKEYLSRAEFNVKKAIVMYVKCCSLKEAEQLLAANNGVLREVIE